MAGSRNDANGFGRTTATESVGRTTSTNDRITTRRTYNARGSVATETAPHHPGPGHAEIPHVTTYTYDALDRVTNQTLPDGADITTSYAASTDPAGFIYTATVDELNRASYVHQDAFQRQVLRIRKLGAANVNTIFDRGRLGRLIGVTDQQGSAWTNTYDFLGNRTSAIDPDLGKWTFNHDKTGNLITRVDALGQITRFTYDGLSHQLVKVVRHGTAQAQTTTNTYDEARAGAYNVGHLTTTSNAAATQRFDHDVAGRLTNVCQSARNFDPQSASKIDPHTAYTSRL